MAGGDGGKGGLGFAYGLDYLRGRKEHARHHAQGRLLGLLRGLLLQLGLHLGLLLLNIFP